ncbi:hypothetical protein [Bordetella bronchialis]|uniref:Uncharacterized protein n=1 Tax=Bordetella bronchialis TaxID=463025 RepID=A0A193G1I9_9BORD|nr:hypothetical protein [Bordetella bronchialis]ANN68393.1 hypothetical protein BAU06_20690 [Bordetella bronchialis]ANN73533.1 hypothetical protein BAU08_21220 [Bordetella bronchialis]
MQQTFDRIPVGDSSFAYQKYITRVSVLDLFCGLDVQGAGIGQAAELVLDIPFDPKAEATVQDWILGQTGTLLDDKANAFFAAAIGAAPGALTWLENEAFAVLKDAGDKTLPRIIVLIVKRIWDKMLSFLSTGVQAAGRIGNAVLELMKDERLIMRAAVRFLAHFFKEHVVARIAHTANAARVGARLAFLTAKTCHTVLHRLGPTAYSDGMPRLVSSGIHLARALTSLMDSVRLTNAAYQVAGAFGCVVAWPIKVAAALAEQLLTLMIRVSEHLRMGRLIGYARAFAQDRGYRTGIRDQGVFVVPELDAAGRKAHEKAFDAFFGEHVGWFPAAAALCLLVPNGVGDPWSYLNLANDGRYWSTQDGQVSLQRARFEAAVAEMQYLRQDARLYLGSIGLAYTHARYDMARAIGPHASDDPTTVRGFFYYLGLLATAAAPGN